ncbi:MAG: hypothetical protein L0229_22480 [Blastocatellia bacterium]|nr:hypothetical protein [Blastocatellia bacterium]
MDERPVAIIRTFPFVFFREKSLREFVREWYELNQDDVVWICPMHRLPKIEVPYVYIVALNRLRYRVNLVGFEPGGERIFESGRRWTANHWMLMAGPVVKAPHKMVMSGFQGFRYSGFIF